MWALLLLLGTGIVWLFIWAWKWILAPFFIGVPLFWVLVFASCIPFLGVLLHGGVIVFTFINIETLPLLENQSTGMYIVVCAVLALALIDCIHELLFTVKTKLYKNPSDDDVFMYKWMLCSVVPAIGSAVYYYATPADQSRLANILSHYGMLLFLFIAPRALFIIGEFFAKKIIYPKVVKQIASGEFFKLQDDSDTVYSVYYKRYVKMQERKGLVVSNSSTVHAEKKTSHEKLEKMYPKKFIEKIAEFVAGDKDILEKRKNAEKELENIEKKISHISQKGYQAFGDNAENILRQVSSISPRDFIEIKFPEKKDNFLSLGVDFFLVKAFETAVSEGRIEDDPEKSNDPIVNHAYRHIQSNVQVLVRNADDDPSMAL